MALSRAQYHQLAAVLKLFGCNQREASVYIQALQMGPSSIQDIARNLKQNRVTIHDAAQQLIEKGFLLESRRGRRRILFAEEPIVLYRILQQRENELSTLRGQASNLVELLRSIRTTETSVPTVQFYEGAEGFRRMLELTLSAKGEVLVFTYVDLFASALSPDYLEDYFRRRAALGISTRLIYPPSTFGARVNKRANQYKIQIRILPEHFIWNAGIFLGIIAWVFSH